MFFVRSVGKATELGLFIYEILLLRLFWLPGGESVRRGAALIRRVERVGPIDLKTCVANLEVEMHLGELCTASARNSPN